MREIEDLMEQNKATKNQLHALNHRHNPPQKIKNRLQELIDFINKQIAEIEKEIKTLVDDDLILKEKITNVCTIKGVSFTIAITIIHYC